MTRTAYLLLAASAVLALFIWLVGAPGCNPEPPEVDIAREHAARADSAERRADAYADSVAVLRAAVLAQDSLIAEARAETQRVVIVASEANAEADRLLAEYRDATVRDSGATARDKRDNPPVAFVCSAALSACTEARIAQDRVIRAQSVEIAALSDQVTSLTRLDSLRAGETAAMREAFDQMESAYLSMEQAYEHERRRRLIAKRRLWVERAAWVGVLGFVVTR